jgi:hypothetical protein
VKVCDDNCWRDCESCKHFAKDEESDKWGRCAITKMSVAKYETCEDFHCTKAEG